MMIQWLVIGIIISAAAAYLAHYAWRAWHGQGTGCGCGECAAGKKNG